jgi:hypothetical protein
MRLGEFAADGFGFGDFFFELDIIPPYDGIGQ